MTSSANTQTLRIRKRIRVIILAGVVAAVIVPLGFALSVDSGPRVAVSVPAFGVVSATATGPSPTPFAVTTLSNPPLLSSSSDAVKLLLVGITFFGLAAIIRRAG